MASLFVSAVQVRLRCAIVAVLLSAGATGSSLVAGPAVTDDEVEALAAFQTGSRTAHQASNSFNTPAYLVSCRPKVARRVQARVGL